jgi:hypothetical protein
MFRQVTRKAFVPLLPDGSKHCATGLSTFDYGCGVAKLYPRYATSGLHRAAVPLSVVVDV